MGSLNGSKVRLRFGSFTWRTDYLSSTKGVQKEDTLKGPAYCQGYGDAGGRDQDYEIENKLKKKHKHSVNCIQMNKPAWRDGSAHMAHAQTEITPASSLTANFMILLFSD